MRPAQFQAETDHSLDSARGQGRRTPLSLCLSGTVRSRLARISMLPRLPKDDSFVSFWIVGELQGHWGEHKEGQGQGWAERRPHRPAQSPGQRLPTPSGAWEVDGNCLDVSLSYGAPSGLEPNPNHPECWPPRRGRGLPPGRASLPAHLALLVRQPKASLWEFRGSSRGGRQACGTRGGVPVPALHALRPVSRPGVCLLAARARGVSDLSDRPAASAGLSLARVCLLCLQSCSLHTGGPGGHGARRAGDPGVFLSCSWDPHRRLGVSSRLLRENQVK